MSCRAPTAAPRAPRREQRRSKSCRAAFLGGARYPEPSSEAATRAAVAPWRRVAPLAYVVPSCCGARYRFFELNEFPTAPVLGYWNDRHRCEPIPPRPHSTHTRHPPSPAIPLHQPSPFTRLPPPPACPNSCQPTPYPPRLLPPLPPPGALRHGSSRRRRRPIRCYARRFLADMASPFHRYVCYILYSGSWPIWRPVRSSTARTARSGTGP